MSLDSLKDAILSVANKTVDGPKVVVGTGTVSGSELDAWCKSDRDWIEAAIAAVRSAGWSEPMIANFPAARRELVVAAIRTDFDPCDIPQEISAYVKTDPASRWKRLAIGTLSRLDWRTKQIARALSLTASDVQRSLKAFHTDQSEQ